jgi:hypothetical protein
MGLLVPNELIPEGEGLLLVVLVEFLIETILLGVVGPVDGLDPVGVWPGVALGCVQTLMPKELLDVADRSLVLEKVSGAGVVDRVKSVTLAFETSLVESRLPYEMRNAAARLTAASS